MIAGDRATNAATTTSIVAPTRTARIVTLMAVPRSTHGKCRRRTQARTSPRLVSAASKMPRHCSTARVSSFNLPSARTGSTQETSNARSSYAGHACPSRRSWKPAAVSHRRVRAKHRGAGRDRIAYDDPRHVRLRIDFERDAINIAARPHAGGLLLDRRNGALDLVTANNGACNGSAARDVMNAQAGPRLRARSKVARPSPATRIVFDTGRSVCPWSDHSLRAIAQTSVERCGSYRR